MNTAISHFLALLAFLCVFLVVKTLLVIVLRKAGYKAPFAKLFRLLSPVWLEAVLVISLVATLGSLFYSEVAGLTPCVLCWYQRILMYPQPILAYLALVRRERIMIRPYLIALNALGLLVALYHNALQWLPQIFPPAPCDFKGVSCAKIYPIAFSWVTIPMMSAVAFLTLLTILIFYGKTAKRV